MPTTLSRFATPEVERLLLKLKAAEDCHTELRARERLKHVFPVQVYDENGVVRTSGYTRDLSQKGFGLVTVEEIPEGSMMTIVLTLPDGITVRYLAMCCWAGGIENSLHQSGWELTSDSVDMEPLAEAQQKMKWAPGLKESIKISIPAMILEKGSRPLTQAFTCDLAGDGANLIVNKEIAVNSFCKLKIFGSDGELYEIIAKSVSCRQYSPQHWLISWEFPRIDRIAQFHAASLTG